MKQGADGRWYEFNRDVEHAVAAAACALAGESLPPHVQWVAQLAATYHALKWVDVVLLGPLIDLARLVWNRHG